MWISPVSAEILTEKRTKHGRTRRRKRGRQTFIEERSVQAGAIRRATMLETGSREGCAAVRRHRFPRRDPARHDLNVYKAAEEIVRALSCARQHSPHARAPMPQQKGQSTMARPCPDDKLHHVPEDRLGNVAHTPVRPERANVNRQASAKASPPPRQRGALSRAKAALAAIPPPRRFGSVEM